MIADSVPLLVPPGAAVSDASPPADAAGGGGPGAWQPESRELCVYRRVLVRDLAREKQRVRGLLTAGIGVLTGRIDAVLGWPGGFDELEG